MAISETKMQMVIANYFKDECDVNMSIRQAFERGFRIGVKKGASANRPQGWIPCSERLPSNSGDVLITIKGDDFVASGTYAGYHSGQWWYLCEDGEITGVPITADVLAWMPMIEPWKGADDEDV